MKRRIKLIPAVALVIASMMVSSCNKVEETSVSTELTTTTAVESETEETTEATTTTVETTQERPTDPAAFEYSLVWEDNFDGDTLNTDDWNYELHQPGWVNNELQYYVNDEDVVFVEDGDLVIQPIREVDEDGRVTYRSGRVNTWRHHDFTYGRIEARMRVPEGQGYLPAFWMMPTRDSVYGSWPKCGEIDIMEIVGSDTTTTYGNLHFGNPHEERQSIYQLESGDFSSEYHIFALEWEPGVMRWFIDDVEIGCQNDWFTGSAGGSRRPYPAPFNQDFYIIFNIAVGGNWPGDPDETTPFDERAQMRVDWVRVYQRGWYDEDVEAPSQDYDFRQADSTGNFVVDDAWAIYFAEGGAGDLSVNDDGEMVITSTNAGTVDYGVQLVQTGLPAQDSMSYTVTFEARADEARTMIAAVTAPDHGYVRYLEDETVELDTSWQTYTYTFTMTGTSDDNARLEFNMGNTDSTATIYMRNVRVEAVRH